jgi:hypothetical protein
MENNQNILHVARSWRDLGPQQLVAVHSLSKALPEFHLHFHICVSNEPSEKELQYFQDRLPDGTTFGLYPMEILDEYSFSCGASSSQVEKFKRWKWIYHLILYHALFYEEKVDYLLSYDDDIFFNGDLALVKNLISLKNPFAMQDLHSDGDKALFPQLINFFGPEIHDAYYTSTNNEFSSNSGFMGVNNRKIFAQFPKGEAFRAMLDMFTYEPYSHGKTGLKWKEYKILLQEQSFLGILNRSLCSTHFVLNDLEHGYSVEHIERSPVQHYVAEKKYSREFKERVAETLLKLKSDGWNSRT